MDLLTKEERENLIIEYKHMHDDNWQRGHGIWLVNSILVTGSLLIAFQTSGERNLAYLASLVLILTAMVIQVTAGKVTSETYEKMREIRKQLGLTETEELYRSRIVGKWWYIIRTNAAYVLFIFLIGFYLFLLREDYYLTLIVYCTGFIILLIKEMYFLSRRVTEKESR